MDSSQKTSTLHTSLLSIFIIAGLFQQCQTDVVFVTPSSDGTTTVSLPESATNPTSVIQLVTTDLNGGSRTYRNLEQDSAPATRFTLVADTIFTDDVFDYETAADRIFILSVEAASGSTSDVGSVTFRVEITDVDDQPPIISGGTTGTVTEEEAIGAIVVTSFGVTDADSVTEIYSITGEVANFQINSGTGVITTTAVLDYESDTSFAIILHVNDEDPAHEVTQAITISVTDINDNSPVFTDGDALYATIAENTASGVSVKQLIATDVDTGDTVTYGISGGDETPAKFTLVGDEIQTTANPIDYESRMGSGYKFSLLVTATDTVFTTTSTLYITITGENDFLPVWGTFSPVWPGASTSITDIAENSVIGTYIVDVAATDDDDGLDGAILFSLGPITASTMGGVTTGLFHIDPTTGVLTTATNTFERDTVSGVTGIEYYDVVVKATDQGSIAQSVERTVRVGITDVNDNTPTFSQNRYTESISEGDSAGTSVARVTASDDDVSYTLSYAIDSTSTPASYAAKFELDSGIPDQINLLAAINLDAAGADSVYTLIIMVDDGGGKSSSTEVAITVTNVNQHSPTFGADQTETVSETATVGTAVASMVATDGDSGTDGTITYSITGGDTNSQFYIDPDSGDVQVVAELDYESTPQYILLIEGKDGGSTAFSSTGTMTVDVIDENDNSPSCTVSSASASFFETDIVTTPITSLTCEDVDATDTLTYGFASGNDGGEFTIDATGAITLYTTVDYDAGFTAFALVVGVTDGTFTVSVPVTVTVKSINEAAPSFPADASHSFAESTSVGTDLVTYPADDADIAPHGVVSYQIADSVTNSGRSYFNIDTETAKITLAKALDFEALPTGNEHYIIEIVAMDGGYPIPFSATGTVTIVVTDSNDNTPSCTPSAYVKTVAEDAVVDDDVIADFGCTDGDARTTLIYSIASQTPSSHFKVDTSVTPKLAVASALDFETTDNYELTVTVSDGSLSMDIYIAITITDVNDGPPTFNGGTYTATVAENSNAGVSVADVIADDEDLATSSFGNLVYSFVSGNDGTKFSIDPSTARISVSGELDAETQSTYYLVVQALEESRTNSATVTCTVTVTDLNDNSPSCTSAEHFSVSILETFTADVPLHEMLCSDADSTDTVTYTLTLGAAYFTLNANVLELRAPIDYDNVASPEFQIAVDVYDGMNTLAVTGLVIVTGVNEDPPVFTEGTYTVSKAENIATGSLITTVTAIDDDKGDTVTYSWVDTPTTFTLYASSGKIELAGELDREVDSIYSLLVRASDGTNVITATVSVTVTDENDNAPIFSPDTYSNTVSEGDGGGATVTTVTATDLDDPATNDYGTVAYIIASGGDAKFIINSANGEITTTAELDYDDTTSYTLYVEAYDSGGAAGARTSTTQVTVAVGNVNEDTPSFVSATISPIVSETEATGTSIAQVEARDTDAGDDGVVFYTMSSHSDFNLDSATGVITINSDLDYDNGGTQSYTLEVVAHDTGAVPNSATAIVSITVSDENDNAPDCAALDTASVPENTGSGNTVATLVCTDADSTTNAALTYTIISVDDVATSGPFAINAGVITTTGLNYEADSMYTILVDVSDGGNPSLTTTAMVQIEVTDVNEFHPAYSGTPYSNSVPETAVTGTTVFTVLATDDDADSITFSLSPSSTYFEIDEISGKIYLTIPIDYDGLSPNPMDLVVLAKDDGTDPNPRTGTATVTITVVNSNDGTPVFSPMTYGTTFSEISAVGDTVLTVTATDIDDVTVTYSIFDGNTGSVFTVASNGDVKVADATNLDYDIGVQHYDLVIHAVDGSSLTGSTTVNVDITGYNEHNPTFASSSTTVSISESAALATSVHDIVDATDDDLGDDGIIEYSFVSGDDGKFSINSNTGLVAVAAELDRETTSTYTIVVAATDKGVTPGTLDDTFSLIVNIDDENDVIPTCGSTTFTASVSEDATTGTSVAQLACTDADATSINNVINGYAISSGNDGLEFAISASGEITTTAVGLDRETTASYSLTIHVTDNGAPTQTATITYSVDVTDVNDNDPAFTAAQYDVSIDEGQSIGTTLGSVAATDDDTGVNAQLMFAIISGNGDGKFGLDGVDLVTIDALDYETDAHTYLLEIHAIDEGTAKLTGTSSISVTVNDVNDSPPSCTSELYQGFVAEDAAASTTVLTPGCTDPDSVGPTLIFSIVTGNTGTAFAIDASNGEITPAAVLNYESLTTYTLGIQVTDGTYNTLISAIISVTDVNDETPQFDPAGPYSETIDEHLAVGSTVYDINANDTDVTATNFAYTITVGNTGDVFTIDASDGIIKVAKEIDRDNPLTPTYTLTVEVADGVHTSTTSIVVTVNDINDNSPSCDAVTYVDTLDEETSSGEVVVTPACTDLDVEASPTLLFSITTGNSDGKFQIDSSTGVIRTQATTDYESVTTYSLAVKVEDQGLSSLSTMLEIVINIMPVNEYAPVFQSISYTGNVAEDVTLGSSIIHVTATDADLGDSQGTVTFSIIAGNDDGDFSIDPTTGDIAIAGGLDREALDNYGLTVQAIDSVAGATDARSSSIVVVVNVEDANDNRPVCDAPTATFAEDTATSTPIATLTCTDADLAANSDLTYTIVEVNGVATGDPFSMTGSAIINALPFDYDTVTSYAVVVEVNDGGASSLTTTTTVNVVITDINEYTPSFQNLLYAVSIPESTAVGDAVFIVTATDSDSANTLTYSINPADANFDIDGNTGIISASSELTLASATPQITELVVYAEDDGTVDGTLSSSATVTVTVTNVNDGTPLFSRVIYIASVNENDGVGTSVTQVTATDSDNAVLTYTITGGNTGNVFRIDATGEIAVDDDTSLDYDSGIQTYSLVITAADDAAHVATSTVQIYVTNYNEHTPALTLVSSLQTVAEDEAIGFVVVDVDATDDDAGTDGNITYTITSGNGDSVFAVNPDNGEVSLAKLLDMESTTTYTIYIDAVDGGTTPGPLSTQYQLTVNVEDVNDISPECNSDAYSATISEGDGTGTSVAQLTCIDGDADPANINNDISTYIIISGNGLGQFAISSTGEVTINSGLDREATPSYDLVIRLADSGTALRTTTTNVHVTVSDENDNSPVFDADPYTGNVDEDTAVDSPIVTVTATDSDTGSNAAISYTIVSGNGAGKYTLDSSTGVLTLATTLDYETDTTNAYVLVVHAIDQGASKLTGTTTVSVAVNDLNDNSPTCTSVLYVASVAEDAALSTTVLTLACSDDDAGDSIAYAIDSGNTATAFSIGVSNGEITTLETLDTEILPDYALIINVTDGTYTKQVRAVIGVTDVNDNTPAFDPAGPFSANMAEDEAADYSVYDVDATDADKTPTTFIFTITGGNTDSKFEIDSASGVIKLAHTIDRDNPLNPLYTLTLEVTDGTDAASTTSIDITIDDVNDNYPSCGNTVYTVTQDETTSTGITVLSPGCTDLDVSASPTLTYAIATGNDASKFSINSATGIVVTQFALDYETEDTLYDLSITVDDQGSPRLVSTIYLSVTINPVNEYAPVFSESSYSHTVAEDETLNAQVFQVTASDSDTGGMHGNITFSISAGNGDGNFVIDGTTGWISVAADLDRESIDIYTLTILATDSEASAADAKSSSSVVSISIGDVNDNTPTCSSPATVSFVESTGTNTVIASLTCTDIDASPSSDLTYTIKTVNTFVTTSPFSIDSGGVISLAGSFDYETDPLYAVVVEIVDSDASARSTTVTVNVQVTDINEETPSFQNLQYSFTVSELTTINSNVYVVSAADGDTDNTVTYSFNPTSSYFAIDTNTGIIYTIGTINFDQLPSSIMELVVYAEDDGTNPSALTASATVTATVSDVNDVTPVFNPSMYAKTVNENDEVGKTLATVIAYDADDVTVTYSLDSGNTGNVFRIDPSGDIVIDDTTNLDYDSSLQAYSLVVYATDSGGNIGTATVTLEVTNYNDNNPQLSVPSSSPSFSEDTAVGEVIVDVDATDADFGTDGNITYTIASGNDDNKFAIDPISGIVTLAASLDRETTTGYVLLIDATDQGTNPSALSAQYTLTVTVNDVNDETPACDPSQVTATISENTPSGNSIAQLTCSDADQDPANINNAITTYVISGDVNGHFQVSTSGEVTTNSVLDREAIPTYSMEIHVSDVSGAASLTTTVSLSVILTDENDETPAFGSDPYNFNIDEDSDFGTAVGAVAATESDSGSNAVIQYSIFSGNTASKFAIDSSTGSITLVGGLDYETDETAYLLEVRAIDEGSSPNTGTTTVSIDVNDVNDNDPSCTDAAYTGTVSEAASGSTTVLTVTCTDTDPVGVVLAYTITTGNTAGSFDLGINNGELTTAAGLDAENLDTYTLAVEVSDGSRTTSVEVHITVTDVNDNPPQFDPSGSYTQTIDEELAVGSSVYDVNAIDVDISPTTIAYSITTGNTDSVFVIDSDGLITISKQIDRDDPLLTSYSLTIEVSDSTHASTTSLDITIADINDNYPLCDKATYEASVDEGTLITLLSPTCTDLDLVASPVPFLFTITNGNAGNVFQIDSSSGTLQSVGDTDYESVPMYTLTVTVNDQGTANLVTTIEMVITINPVNEITPTFSDTPYTGTVTEDAALGDSVFQVSATDTDTGNSQGTITFSIIDGNSDGRFAIDSVTGVISVIGELDREAVSNYPLTVQAIDSLVGASDARSVTEIVTISVTDVNDKTPACSPYSQTVSFNEDVSSNPVIATLLCTDDDEAANSDLTFTILYVNGVSLATPFAMSGNDVTLSGSFDYEADASYTVVIEVKDSGTTSLSTNTLIYVLVADINEYSPVFLGTPYRPSRSENTALGTTLYRVSASDDDIANTVTYSIDSPNSYVDIDPTSGDVYTIADINFESFSPNPLEIIVIATDDGTSPTILSSSATVTITVTDINDVSPVFTKYVYTGFLSEVEPVGSPVLQVSVTDADDASPTYSIVNGNSDNVFSIDDSTGDIVVDDDTNLDYDSAVKDYYLQVQATDANSNVGSAVVYIYVTNSNEFTPSLTIASSAVNIAENEPIGYTVVDVSATDSDHGVDGDIVYTIASGNGEGKFAINASDGTVTLAAELDKEATDVFTVRIDATDGGTNPGAKSSQFTLTVTVTDVNDVVPICTKSQYSATISETHTVGASVAQLVCYDLDNDPAGINNNVASYTVTSGDDIGEFTISASGLVTTTRTLDFETIAVYLLKIDVKDSSTAALSTSTSLLVLLTEANEHPPVFGSATYNFNADEDTAVGITLGTVAASDQDSGLSGEFLFSIDSGNVDGLFELDWKTGDLVLIEELDFETGPSYTIVVHAVDKGSVPSTGAATITVTVNDVNDYYPTCTASRYSASVPEDKATSMSVVTVSCSETVETVGSPITYSITGTDFAIDTNSGVVSTNAALNVENIDAYTLLVTAFDGGLSVEVMVDITVTDVNDEQPAFSPAGPYSADVSEDVSKGYIVMIVDATDVEYTPTTFIYSITGGNTGGEFAIDPSTGVIQTKTALDRDSPPITSYTLDIQVADGTGSSFFTATTSLVITLTDVNDNSPSCGQTTYTVTLPEDTTSGDTIVTLDCSDLDLVASPTVAYSITDGNTDNKFQVQVATGVVRTIAPLDYESATDYTLTVLVDDSAGKSISVTVAVIVEPVNEDTPAFSATYTPSVVENAAIGYEVVDIDATDPDTGPTNHGVLRFEIISGNNAGNFAIHVSTGSLTVSGGLNRENVDSYPLTVRVSDSIAGAAEVLYTDTTVLITVTDYNDNYPVFNPASYIVSFVESVNTGTTVAHVTATDDDDGQAGTAGLQYAIIAGNTDGKFGMTGDAVTLAAAVDAFTTSVYTLTIQATDQGSSSLATTTTMTLQISASNEHTPVFTVVDSTMSLPESTAIGTSIYQAAATDSDTGDFGELRYYMESGNTDTAFLIGETTGGIHVANELDYDTSPIQYILTFRVEDTDTTTNTTRSSTGTLTINLSDVNDETPTFTANTYSTNVDENVITTTSVITVLANDLDSAGSNAAVTYSIIAGTGITLFSIGASSGQVVVAGTIDYETAAAYDLTVRAVDGGTSPLSSSCVVQISINDQNDETPSFEVSNLAKMEAEDVSIGTVIITVNAQDQDSAANDNNKITYSFDVPSVLFAVDPDSGAISVADQLDREAVATHTLYVLAKDGGSPTNTGTATVTIVLSDVNDKAPVVTGTYDVTIAEDTPENTVVHSIVATDDDEGDNAVLTYAITNGDTNSDFKISGGHIQVSKVLDRETTAMYHLEVTVTDGGTPSQNAVTTATVTISDVNDNPPVFQQDQTGTYFFSVFENVQSGTLVGRVSATDADDGSNVSFLVAYFSLGDNTNFDLHPTTGDVTTATATLDREAYDAYSFIVRASDNGLVPMTSTVTVSIDISDTNDQRPTFQSTLYTATTAEQQTVGTSILTVEVVDADLGVNSDITYTIDRSTAAGVRANLFFKVDSATSILQVKQLIDREVDESFGFSLIATDAGSPALSSTTSVSIIVDDSNDNSPIFSPDFYDSEIAYNDDCQETVAQVIATDGDGQIVTYSDTTNPLPTAFSLAASSGVITMTSNADADKKYVLEITATDAGTPALSSVTDATVRIDTYDPNVVVLNYYMSITRASYLAIEDTFLSQLTTVYQSRYSTSRVKRWCVTEEAASSCIVHTYVIKDDTADTFAEIDNTKAFLTSEEAFDITSADTSGTPADVIVGSIWDPYSITRVGEYYSATTEDTSSEAWITTPVGIAVVTVAAVAGVAMVSSLIAATSMKYLRTKTPINQIEAGTGKPDVAKNKYYQKSALDRMFKERDVPSSNERFKTYDKTHPPHSLVDLPLPTSPKKIPMTIGDPAMEKPKFEPPKSSFYNYTNRPKLGAPMAEKPKQISNVAFRSTPKIFTPTQPPPRQEPASDPPPYDSSPFHTTPSLLQSPESKLPGSPVGLYSTEEPGFVRRSPMHKKPFVRTSPAPRPKPPDASFTGHTSNPPIIINREFDGRAIDPRTNKLYEYNTLTNERRWVNAPSGQPVTADGAD